MNNIHRHVEKEFAKWASPDELWEAQDVKDFAYTVAKEAIEIVIGICRMRMSRGSFFGRAPTYGDVANAQIREEVLKYFGTEERDVNEIFDTNVQFREHFKCPRKGDPTYEQ